jgi:hypothetical protein
MRRNSSAIWLKHGLEFLALVPLLTTNLSGGTLADLLKARNDAKDAREMLETAIDVTTSISEDIAKQQPFRTKTPIKRDAKDIVAELLADKILVDSLQLPQLPPVPGDFGQVATLDARARREFLHAQVAAVQQLASYHHTCAETAVELRELSSEHQQYLLIERTLSDAIRKITSEKLDLGTALAHGITPFLTEQLGYDWLEIEQDVIPATQSLIWAANDRASEFERSGQTAQKNIQQTFAVLRPLLDQEGADLRANAESYSSQMSALNKRNNALNEQSEQLSSLQDNVTQVSSRLSAERSSLSQAYANISNLNLEIRNDQATIQSDSAYVDRVEHWPCQLDQPTCGCYQGTQQLPRQVCIEIASHVPEKKIEISRLQQRIQSDNAQIASLNAEASSLGQRINADVLLQNQLSDKYSEAKALLDIHALALASDLKKLLSNSRLRSAATLEEASQSDVSALNYEVNSL